MTANTNPGDAYRPDIDGLRALAVLAVIAFHAEIAGFQGGFIGVDVFFVISGYLISSIVFRALRKKSFTFREFYTRRINRIVPALLVILVACLVAGWVVLMPGEYRSIGKHVFGSSAFVSNVILWREAGYFDSPTKPLLHLWSLAVEEQFYLVWPPLALLAWRRKWNLVLTISLVIAVSLIASLWSISRSHTVAAFYFPGTRFWQIAAGALLAQVTDRSRSPSMGTTNQVSAAREAAAFVGLGLLVLAMLVIDHETPWPGLMATLPVVGTVLLIATGPDAWIGRALLGHPALVNVGLISYPLYLWHWPLMVVARLINGGPIGWLGMTSIVVLAFVLAWLTYRLVEIPIRFGNRKRRSAALLLPTLAVVGLLGLCAHAGWIRPRLFEAATAFDRIWEDRDYPGEGGFDAFGRAIVDSIPGSADYSVALLGDSHIQQYWPRVVRLSKAAGADFPTALFMTYGSCVPMPGVERKWNPSPLTQKPFQCAKYHRVAMERINAPRVRAVVFSANWEVYLTNAVTFLEGEEDPLSVEGSQTDSAFAVFARELRQLTQSGKRVYILLNNPVDSAYDPASRLPSRLPWQRTKPPVNVVSRSRVAARSAAVNERLRKVAAAAEATIIDPFESLCGPSRCPTVSREGAPIYRDAHHMRASFVSGNASWIDRVFGRESAR